MTVIVYQNNIEVLGGVTFTPGVRLYQAAIEVLGTTEVVEVPSVTSSENVNTKNRTMLGVG